MNVSALSKLRNFWENAAYRDSEQPLKAWLAETLKANWSQPADIKAHYGNASIIGKNRVVFKIKGNDYRLIVGVAYKMQWVYVKFVGTHKQYDEVDAETIEQF